MIEGLIDCLIKDAIERHVKITWGGRGVDAGNHLIGIESAVVAIMAVVRSGLPREERQKAVYDWAVAAFGEDHCVSLGQRGIRFFEEACELYQRVMHEGAVAPADARAMAHKMLDYVMDRPVGEMANEFGGVGITLLCLAQAAKISADSCEAAEFERVLAKPLKHFTARNQVKNDAGFNVVSPQ